MIAIAVPLIALVTTSAASLVLQYNERQERRIGTLESTLTVDANRDLADAVDAEAGLRGYAATGDPLFLAPYNETLRHIAADTATLRASADAAGFRETAEPPIATTMDEIARLKHMRAAIAAGATGPQLTAELKDGKRVMDRLRHQIGKLTDDPSETLVIKRSDITRMEMAIGGLSVAGLLLGLVTGVMGIALFTSGISRRVAVSAANASRLGEGRPLVPVPHARDELGRLACSLRRAKAFLDDREQELIKARDEALTATQAKNAFLSSTSHELRTPLNAILGFTQLLQLSDLSPEDRDSVGRILAAGRYLLSLINELIDIARIEAGELSLSVEPVRVQPLVDGTIELMTPLAAERSISVGGSCPHEALSVLADRQRLGQILMNLVSNAIKYNSSGGNVTITCAPDTEKQARIVVSDNGPGINAQDLDRIFRPFERLGAEQTGIEGTGIGLPLARALAEAMNGQIIAASVPGKGSTFTVILPRAADMAPAEYHPAALSHGPPDHPSAFIRVLYIEDNPANIEVVSRFLKTRPNIRLRSAASGRAGLELAARDVPDLVLLDLHLPDMRGDKVLGELRAEHVTAGVPVAVLSAEAAPTVIRHMHSRGVIAYLTKPLDLGELGRFIDTFTPVADGELHADGRAAAVTWPN